MRAVATGSGWSRYPEGSGRARGGGAGDRGSYRQDYLTRLIRVRLVPDDDTGGSISRGL